MVTKALGLWLFVVGVLWTVGNVWLHLAMTTVTEPVGPLPVYFVRLFIGPAIGFLIRRPAQCDLYSLRIDS